MALAASLRASFSLPLFTPKDKACPRQKQLQPQHAQEQPQHQQEQQFQLQRCRNCSASRSCSGSRSHKSRRSSSCRSGSSRNSRGYLSEQLNLHGLQFTWHDAATGILFQKLCTQQTFQQTSARPYAAYEDAIHFYSQSEPQH